MKMFAHLLGSLWLYRLTRIFIGSIFIYAGAMKLFDPKAFAATISQYGLVPEILLAPVAICLPVLEVIAGAGLIFHIRWSLSVIFSLLVMFVFVLWYGILKDLNIDCGCFSPLEISTHNSLRYAFYRDLVMLAGVMYMFFFRRFSLNERSTVLSGVNNFSKEDSQ